MGEHKGFDEPGYQAAIYEVHETDDRLCSVICRMKGLVHGKEDCVSVQVIPQVVPSVNWKCVNKKIKSLGNKHIHICILYLTYFNYMLIFGPRQTTNRVSSSVNDSLILTWNIYYKSSTNNIHLASPCLPVSKNCSQFIQTLLQGWEGLWQAALLKVVLSSRTVVVVRSVRDGWASGPKYAAQTRGLCLSGSNLLAAEGL